MPSPRIPDAVRRVFTEAFAARDIAEPLASNDANGSAADVRGFMETRNFDVVGIRSDGQIVGYVDKGWLQEGACGQFQRGFDARTVLEDTAPLLTVLMELKEVPFGCVT